MSYFSRAAWGAQPATSQTPWTAGNPTSWTLHYEGADIDITKADYAPTVRSIQNYHMNVSPEGYTDIAYNFLVAPNGDTFEGRGWSYKSGAQADGNSSSLAICYLGGPTTPLTLRAQAGFKQFIAHKPMGVFPHDRWIPTSCPGPAVRDFIPHLNWWVLAGCPEDNPTPKPRKAMYVFLVDTRTGDYWSWAGGAATYLDGPAFAQAKRFLTDQSLPVKEYSNQNYLIDQLKAQGLARKP